MHLDRRICQLVFGQASLTKTPPDHFLFYLHSYTPPSSSSPSPSLFLLFSSFILVTVWSIYPLYTPYTYTYPSDTPLNRPSRSSPVLHPIRGCAVQNHSRLPPKNKPFQQHSSQLQSTTYWVQRPLGPSHLHGFFTLNLLCSGSVCFEP